MTQKINKLTSRIVENGMLTFFQTFGRFFAKVHGIDTVNNDTDYRRVSMKQFFFPLVIYFISMMVSILVFGLEIIYFNFQKKRQISPISSDHHDSGH